MKFNVPDMSCGHCAAAIEKAVKSVDPDASVEADLASRTVTIASAKDPAWLQGALREAGYPATPV